MRTLHGMYNGILADKLPMQIIYFFFAASKAYTARPTRTKYGIF